MANSNTTTKSIKGAQDKNSVVTTGAIINGAEVTEKRQQAVVLKYNFGANACTGVMHVSQFPSLERSVRDQMFAEVVVGAKFDGLEAAVEAPNKAEGRRFTSVRLSGRAPLQRAADQKREAQQAERKQRESAQAEALESVDGKVVSATLKKLAFAKHPETKQETDHCFGAFLVTNVNGVEVSGLLHTSRMVGKGRIDRLIAAAQEEGTVFEVVASKTEKGISFSEEGVKAAKEQAVAAEREQRQSGERENFLVCIREALAAGTAEKMHFPAKVTANRLDSSGGVSCEACGVRVEVSSADLAIPASNMRGIGHQVKLVAIAEQDGVITAKRFVKSK